MTPPIPAMANGAAPASHPDAELLALGREIDHIQVCLSEASRRFFASDSLCGELIAGGMESAEAERRTGVLIAERSETLLSDRYTELSAAILAAPATTFAGLAVKARIPR